MIEQYATIVARSFWITIFLLLAIWAITLEHYNLVIGGSALAGWLTTALKAVAPELAGIVIGVVTIDYLNERRQHEERRTMLTREMLSNVTDTAVRAVETLKENHWLDDILKKHKQKLNGVKWREVDLKNADLSDANLIDAVLSKAKLHEAQLPKAQLGRAKLQRANLQNANLQQAYLAYADLEGANLIHANLAGADLREARLAQAKLRYTDLMGANVTLEVLNEAKTLHGAIMPDGTKLKSKWNPNGSTFAEWAGTKGWSPKEKDKGAN
ncbi:MAG: pentapeptide repeat-containing protein [Chloroflexota bacterium]